ncbi:unnamed protein product [Paramecium octaurelia]|uniref:Lysophospholipid acyltransferase n=1 Tax=Paramecium octaurelia TaxID=43137 RepID=A0A8S1W489_PAROT|nr:unnamed protein product [Paramecium octaurelia]
MLLSFFEWLGGLIGLPEDQARMVFGFIITIPLGFLFKSLKSAKLRKYFGLTIGLLLSYMLYQEKLISVIIQNIIVYEMTKRITLNKIGIKAKWVFYETLIYVAVHHIYRQYTDYGGWKLDITTILMMNTVKWTSFAYNFEDGLRKDEELNSDQQERKLQKMPSYTDYFGYMFFFCGCLAGPSFDYYDYDIFIKRTNVYEKIPSTFWETFRLFRNALIYSFFIVVVYPRWSLESLMSAEYDEACLLYKILWLNLTITLHRTKYVSGWLFSESGLAAAGFTYNGKQDGKDKWLRIRSIDPTIDLTTNPKDKIELWNISVQVWLKKYVYLRVYPESVLKSSPAKSQKAQLITFAVSAFWHGFYPGYYISFFHWNLIGMINKYIHKLGQNTNVLKIWDSNILFKCVRFYFVNSLFNCFGVGFQLMNVRDNLRFYGSVYYVFNLTTYILFAFFTVTQFGQKPRKKQ